MSPRDCIIQVPPDFVTRERGAGDDDPDQRPPRMNQDGGHKKRHASELYDSKSSGIMGGRSHGATGNGSGKGSGGGHRPPSIMGHAASGGPRDGGPGASGAGASDNH